MAEGVYPSESAAALTLPLSAVSTNALSLAVSIFPPPFVPGKMFLSALSP